MVEHPTEYLATMEALRSSEAKRMFKEAIIERDGGRCRYCGSNESLTLDHIKPRCRGGQYTASNLVTACRSCNQDKASHEVWTWFRSQPFFNPHFLRSISL